jgi:lysophospholipase L1-like esterase
VVDRCRLQIDAGTEQSKLHIPPQPNPDAAVMYRRLPLLFAICIIPLTSATAFAGDFALKDGDTVVFLGDSITAARTYGEIIENYTLLRYPKRKVRFYNAGWGGDTAAGGAARLERDVFSRGATVVTVAYGVNDIGWGLQADESHKKAYLDAVRSIVTECRRRKVRVYICSAAITAEDPDKAEKGFLQKMCDEGLALSKKLGGGTIDVQREMRKVQRRVLEVNKRRKQGKMGVTMFAADGVHLNQLGQLAMAFAILKGLGAPADVSSATVDFAKKAVVKSVGCRVSDLLVTESGIEFTRLDDGLPINFGLFGALNFLYVPVHQELNRYLVAVTKLPAGKYALTVDGRGIGTYTHAALARGVNISFATTNAWQPGGPWDAQSTSLKSLTEARSRLFTAQLLWNVNLKESRSKPAIAPQVQQLDEKLQQLQRAVAKPMPYRFRLERAK